MKSSRLTSNFLTSLSIVALLGGCGWAQTATSDVVPNGAIEQGRAHRGSGSSGELLYVSTEQSGGNIGIFTFPQGQQVGQITSQDSADGLCSDKDGNVYAIYFPAAPYEYAHGATKPRRRLHPYQDGFDARACSVDSHTGDLAVAGISGLLIWHRARGNPVVYVSGTIVTGCVYDPNGNLFVFGDIGSQSGLFEMKKGTRTFRLVNLKLRGRANDAPIAWDGQYLVLDTILMRGHRHHYIARVQVNNLMGKVVQLIYVRDQGFEQIAIQGDALIGSDRQADNIGFWSYPQGGKPTSLIPYASTVSITLSVAPSGSHIRK